MNFVHIFRESERLFRTKSETGGFSWFGDGTFCEDLSRAKIR